MKVTIEFNTDNGAFDFDDGSLAAEVENVLDKVKKAFWDAHHFSADSGFTKKLADSWGNVIGTLTYVKDD